MRPKPSPTLLPKPAYVAVALFLLASLSHAQVGCDWQPVGSPSFSNIVEDLVVFDDGSGESLYAVGRFDEIAVRWDGSAWQPVASGLLGYAVTALVHDDGTGDALYIGGCLNQPVVGSQDRVFKLVGNTWQPVTGWNLPNFGSCVLCLEEFVIGGTKRLMAGTNNFTTGLVYRSGASWLPVAVGANVLAMEPFDDGTGNALFLSTSPDGMRRWDGTTLSPAGTLFGVRELRVLDLGQGPHLFGGSDRVYQWTGSAWSPVGGPFLGSGARVRALLQFDDGTGPQLYAGGVFTSAGGTPANGIARWDGASWSAVGTGFSGGGLPGPRDLQAFDDGSGLDLFAGGTFTQAGGVPTNFIARWSCASSPEFTTATPCGQTLTASVGVPISFDVEAIANTGSPGNAITLDVTGQPAGAVHTQPLPTTVAGPGSVAAATTLTWTPSNTQAGTHVLTYTATDQLGAATQCSVTVVVAECYLLLGGTPTNQPVGLGGDALLVEPFGFWPVTMATVPSFPIPNQPALFGLSVFAQVAMYNPQVFANDPLQLTNGLHVTLGVGSQTYGSGGSGMTLWVPQPPTLGGSLTFGFGF